MAVALFSAVADGCVALGRRPSGERRERCERSPQWQDGSFENPQPLWNDMFRAMTSLGGASPVASPDAPVPVVTVDPALFATPPASGLRLTWLGHSTFLVELEGHRILTDPVWSERISPVPWVGPKRFYPPVIALADLPPIDGVVISHDHFDHLDYATIKAMEGWSAIFVVPLGVGEHLAYWGVPEERIVELDWWERTSVGGLEVVCTPARHASGRMPSPNMNQTLWGGFALVGRERRVYYSGDTGLFSDLREIGERLGPFDVTMIEAGAYGRFWPDWHIGPEQAVLAHQAVRGRLLVPAHWGLFNLSYHGWTEPAERLWVAAELAGVALAVPRPGESFEPRSPPPLVRWWPDLPWTRAEEDPIVSSRMGEDPQLKRLVAPAR